MKILKIDSKNIKMINKKLELFKNNSSLFYTIIVKFVSL